MADDERQDDQLTIAVPLRRLITGVPRTKRAPAAIPRIKRYVLRHISADWRDAIWDQDRGVHRVWIDEQLNAAIWSRGRGHVGGPQEWIKGTDGGRPRLAQRTGSRYGSILKVDVLYVEEPEEGGDPRIEVKLFGRADKEREDKEKGHEGHDHAEGEHDHDEDKEGGKDEDLKRPAKAPAKAASEEAAPKKPASTSAAAKGGKPADEKAEPKKAAPKPKKEGGD